MSILSAGLLLFLVLDPVGNVPLFLLVLNKTPKERQSTVILRELLIAFVILALFLFLGRYLLQMLQISQCSLSIAGGIILFLIALKMIFSSVEGIFTGDPRDTEPFIVPLAVPLIAGPSAMTTVLLLMAREPSRWLDWLLALVLAWGLSGLILMSSSSLSRILGRRTLAAAERLLGMLLTTVAVEMFITGVKQAFPL